MFKVMGVEQPKPQGHGATPQNRGMQQGKHSDRNKDKKIRTSIR